MTAEVVEYLSIAVTAGRACLEVLAVALIGFLAARTGIISQETEKRISKLNINLFTPCLVFSQLGSSLSLENIQVLEVVPLYYVVMIIVCFVVARVVCAVCGISGTTARAERNFVAAVSVFSTTTSLPVSLIVSLSQSLPNLLWKEIPGDTSAQVCSRGLLYIMTLQQVMQVVKWSWGYNFLLRGPSTEAESRDTEARVIQDTPGMLSETSSLLDSSTLRDSYSAADWDCKAKGKSSDDYCEETWSLQSSTSVSSAWLKKAQQYMNPPLYSCIAALVVSFIPPLQRALFYSDGLFSAGFAKPVTTLGSLAVPLLTLCLGSSFGHSWVRSGNSQGMSAVQARIEDGSESKMKRKLVVASLVCRMVLAPLVLLPVFSFLTFFLPLGTVTDPIFIITMVIVAAGPPAVQLAQICELNECFEQEMGAVLFISYTLLSAPLAICAVVYGSVLASWVN